MELSQRVRAILSFVEAAKAGSFAAAGRQLGVSAAAISKNVAGLELALGLRLMNRTTRTLSLTDEGQIFLGQARVALEALELAGEVLAQQRMEIGGHVRISTSSAFGQEHLLPVLPTLQARYPALSLEVDFDDRLVDLVKEGYDIVLRGGHIADSALISRPICKLNLVLVASPNYLRKHGIPQGLGDLDKHSLIVRRFLGGRVSPWNFRDLSGGIRSLDLGHAALMLSAPEASLQAAVAGMGIAQVGVHQAWRYLLSGQLKALMVGVHDHGNYEMVLQYPHRSLIALRVKSCVDFLLEAFGQDDALHVPLSELQRFLAE